MDPLQRYLGDLHLMVPTPWAEIVLVLVAAFAGAAIGIERERKAKAAGLRTLTLICVGSAIYTMISFVVASMRPMSDPARIAAQILPGVGFIGAGVIFRGDRSVAGLTTAATVWAVAAVGLVIGAGYAIAGIALTVIIFSILTWVQSIERRLLGPCHWVRQRVTYDPAGGKTFLRIVAILDESHQPEPPRPVRTPPGDEQVEIAYCDAHVQHRTHLAPLAELPAIRSVERVERVG